MHAFRVYLMGVLLPLLGMGCTAPSSYSHLTGATQVASRTGPVPLSESTQAVVDKGSKYITRTDARHPGIDLKEGRLLLVKNKDGARCQVMAGPATVELIGTTVLTEKHDGVLRIIDVEGRSRVNWGTRAGEYRMLEPGQMLLVNEGAETLPGPVLVDLHRLVSREELLSSGFLGSQKLAKIDREVARQTTLLSEGRISVQRGALLAQNNTLDTMQAQTAWNGSRMVDTRWDAAAANLNVVTSSSSPAALNGAVNTLVSTTLR